MGVISEEAYLEYLAAHTGIGIETLEDVSPADCLLPRTAIHLCARHSILPIRQHGELVYVSAPHGYSARRIARLVTQYPSLRSRIRLAPVARFNAYLEYHSGDVLAGVAAESLAVRFPHLSAAPLQLEKPALSPVAIPLAACRPSRTHDARPDAGDGYLRRASRHLVPALYQSAACRMLLRNQTRSRLQRLHDSQLPIYTVVAALYREASSVAPLMQYIHALDYPHEKLDIKLVIEADDLQTRIAIARLGPMPHVQVIIAPTAGPKTKPKALNCALTFARGTFITVFDAEDRPDPNQLREALDVFRTHGLEVVCAQASLCIDNTADGWLPRMFTAEYAGQFDVFLQGFSNFEMPLPLGGSSNHFRTSTLREVGGWDPYNVTEDADLGFRLARSAIGA
jgi:hypothetical protein